MIFVALLCSFAFFCGLSQLKKGELKPALKNFSLAGIKQKLIWAGGKLSLGIYSAGDDS